MASGRDLASDRDLANAAFFGLDGASVEERAKVIGVATRSYFRALDWVKLNWTSSRMLTLDYVEKWASAYYRQNTWEDVWGNHYPDEIVGSLDQALAWLATTTNPDIVAKTTNPAAKRKILEFESGPKGVRPYFRIPVYLAGVDEKLFVNLRYHLSYGYVFDISLGQHGFTTYGELETALLSCIKQVETGESDCW